MPKTQTWTIRMIFRKASVDLDQLSLTERLETRDNLPDLWMEQFRYAGIGRILAENDTRVVFELNAPASIAKTQTKIWADMNADRMRSFGINAAAAPKWDGFAPIPE